MVVAKKPLVELELSVSVVVPVLVVALPYWSSSWRPSVMLVVPERRCRARGRCDEDLGGRPGGVGLGEVDGVGPAAVAVMV